MPCHELEKATTSCPPVTSFASRRAASLDSAPVVSSSTFSSGSGSEAASRSASSSTGRLSMPLNRWSSRPTWSRTVATTSGWEWPRIALICPEVKSSRRRPDSVVTQLPSAEAITSGVKLPEPRYRMRSRSRSTTSSLAGRTAQVQHR